MTLLDTTNGILHLISEIAITPNADYEAFKQQLQQNSIEFITEDRYNLYQWVYLKGIKADNKAFQIEIYFDNKNLKSVNLGFNCDEGYSVEYEQWIDTITGGQTIFAWGSIKAEIHPRFDVPLISLSYT